MSTQQKDVYLVIGGSGFVGRHIVEKLVARGDVVSVFDVVQRYDDVPFYPGDITNEQHLLDVLRKTGTTCILHTASPHAGIKDDSVYYKVNVEGTRAVINAALAAGVRKLVYTSSAGIVFDGGNVVALDERAPYPDKPFDAYSDSKAKAEMLVLEANGKGGLLTVSLRPGGIFGPGDRQTMTGLYDVYEKGQMHIQIGTNGNVVDYVYVENLAQAHLLAADKLVEPPGDSTTDATHIDPAVRASLHKALPTTCATIGFRRVPTSRARPLGPYVDPPPNGAEIEAAFNTPRDPFQPTHAIVRNWYDQFSDESLDTAPANPFQVAGQIFFIADGEPIYLWDFFRTVWRALEPATGNGRNKAPIKPVVLSKPLSMVLGYLGETWSWWTGQEPLFTRFRVSYICATRYHNIEKARRVLGFEPEVGLEEGVRRMIKWWKAENNLP